VNVTAVFNRSHLDSGNGLDASLGGEEAHLFHRRRRVVIGGRHDTEACGGRLFDELERSTPAVGGGGMKVEIDPR
jgi:hypothetical protein